MSRKLKKKPITHYAYLMERATGFEHKTKGLEDSHSTAELRPHSGIYCISWWAYNSRKARHRIDISIMLSRVQP